MKVNNEITALLEFPSEIHQLKKHFECPAKWMTVSKLNESHRRNPRNSYFLPEYKVCKKLRKRTKQNP